MPEKYDKFKNKPLEFCPGCRLENQCGKCDIKDCAEEKKIPYCSQCNQFPCKKIVEFNNDGIPHHSKSMKNLKSIEKMGAKEWLEVQSKEWSCECGTKFSWYLKNCTKCSQ